MNIFPQPHSLMQIDRSSNRCITSIYYLRLVPDSLPSFDCGYSLDVNSLSCLEPLKKIDVCNPAVTKLALIGPSPLNCG